MSVIERKSVGNIFYELIDDLYPVHSGITGTIAISQNGDIFSCDGGYVWSTYNQKNLSSEIYSFNHTDTATFLPTLNTWTIPNMGATTPFTGTTNSSGFTFLGLSTTTPDVDLKFDNIGRFLTISNNSVRSSNTQWNQIDWAPSKNRIVPLRYNSAHFGTDAQNDATNIFTPFLFNIDSRLGDSIFMGYRVRSRESNSAYINRRDTKLSTTLFESPIIFYEYGKTQDFNTNKWVVVNDTTNKWFIGSATTFSGGGTSIYVSNNSGTTNTYTNNVAQVSHFYKDISFPKNLQSDVTLSFYWKCVGEVGFDYGRVFLTTTETTPVAGTQVSTTFQIGLANYNNSATYQLSTITIPRVSVIDSTKRLIFSWRNDGSVGTNPPMAIDSLRLHFFVDDNVTKLGDTETFSFNGFSGNSWTVVNNATTFWVVGVSEFSGTSDSYSAYITTANNIQSYGNEFGIFDNRALPAYVNAANNQNNVSHFYKDFTFTSASTLTFNWKCWGENAAAATAFDYGTVVLTTTATTPVANSEVSITKATPGGNGRIGGDSTYGKFNLGYGGADNNWRTETINLGAWSGQTKRLVFTWKNDDAIINPPPFVVDNIKITGVGDWARRIER